VLLVHGKAFNWKHPDHFRIVFLPHIDELKAAIQALGEFLDGYRQS
jgi:alanine-synthesizing transaminase